MSRERRLVLALGLNLVVVVVQVVMGIAAGSVGLLADAGHNLSDVAAIVVSMVAIRLATRPPTSRRSFGWHRSTILAAQANAAAILVVTALIVFEAIGRLREPEPVEGMLVVIAAGIGLVANTASAIFLHERGGHDLNMRSAVLHMVADAATSAGVLLAGLVIVFQPDVTWVDPAVSLVVSVIIARQAIRLLGETADVLLESTPAGLDADELAESIAAVPGVESVHDLHVWSISSDLRALAAHIVIEGHPSLEDAQVVGERVKVELEAHYDIGHATLELECEACPTETDPCVDPLPPGGFARPRGHDHTHAH